MHARHLLLTAASLLAVSAGAAQAQSQTAQVPPETRVDDVIVTALPLARSPNDVVSSVAVLGGDELVHRRQATLGETLSGIPGVSSDTFGGGASRPVIRGQTSPRVRVLSNGAALLDASEISPDHAVSVEPLLVDAIEILRGPSALLYGGGAIGGAINVVDRRIPTRPVDGFGGAVEVRAGTADDERTAVAGLNAGFGGFAVRLEALSRSSDDYAIPSFEPPHEHEEDEDEVEHGPVDVLEGSFNDTSTVSLGASWVGTRGWLGAAFTEQNSDYGLPGHGHEFEGCAAVGDVLVCEEEEEEEGHDHEHEAPVIDLRSRRVDLRGELRDLTPWIERLSFRGGFTDYVHKEVEGDEVATTFSNKGHDARIELAHAPIAGFRGVIGVQSTDSDFVADGDEAYLPESTTTSNALFALEEFTVGDLRFEVAARQERQEASAEGRPDAEHDAFSASGGVVWRFAPGWSASASVSRSQRAPTAQELYADGVHLATNTYEIGTPTLDVETANAVELGLRKTDGATTFSASVYRYRYDGYIYAQTLDQLEEFRLIRYTQSDADFTGVEVEASRQITDWFTAEIFGDLTRGELDGGGDVPRIPAGRLGVRGEFVWDAWSGDVELHHVFEQDRIADFETVTPGYDMLNATVAYDLTFGGADVQVYARGTNLLDELALNHASYLAQTAPLRGRSLVVGIRTTF